MCGESPKLKKLLPQAVIIEKRKIIASDLRIVIGRPSAFIAGILSFKTKISGRMVVLLVYEFNYFINIYS
ncbi:MAG: hypothetical protein ACJAW8_001844 [Oleispira sp.]|jgi:hypothetical protein